MYIHIYLYTYFQKRCMVKCLFNIYIYLLFLIQEMMHTTCTFHIKETTLFISCYMDSSCLLSSLKIVPIIYFVNPFLMEKVWKRKCLYISYI